jgi:N-acetylmuramic acid 6-phosphate etherase
MQISRLMTERRNPATENLDSMSALELVTVMNREDSLVPRRVRRALPEIAKAVDLIAKSFAMGGRLIYVGAGTSGRIGALDASEIPPTFGTNPEMVQFLIAGGENALIHATEASEDSVDLGRRDMSRKRPGKRDVIVGLAASGFTPYTISALQFAKSKGAATVGIACNRGSQLGKIADISIEIEVGPEVLTGSSRLKAGTAQKLICNMLTTGAMARVGYIRSNLMVNLILKNRKLEQRAIAILEILAKVDRTTAVNTLQKAGKKLPVALVMLQAGVSRAEAARRLKQAKGNVRKAIEG